MFTSIYKTITMSIKKAIDNVNKLDFFSQLSLKYLDTASESEGWSTPDYEYDSDGYVVLVAGKPRVKQMDIGEKEK